LYTIRDIARLAQVSTATVSYVINGKSRVSEKLKRRVLDAMDALDYHPDQVARSLRVRRTSTIGVVIPDVTIPFYAEVMRGIEDEARSEGYSVIFCNTNEDAQLERQYLETLFARRVDGVLIASDTVSVEERRFVSRRCPLVFFDRTPPGFTGTAVVSDNVGGGRAAARHLIQLGHTRIAIVTGWKGLSVAMGRLDGFREALQEAKLLLPQDYIRYCHFDKFESAYRNGLELMALPSPPTAVLCCNNKMTLGFMSALAEANVSCPDRVSVCAYDDFEWVASFRPHLTTVAQPTYVMGKKAAELLIKKMRPGADQPVEAKEQIVTLPNELRVRESTVPPRAPHTSLNAGAVV
jgi:LacI family transcriptional regulator